MSSVAAVLATVDLRKVYGGGRDRGRVVAVTDASLAVRPGEVVAIRGPSGSGKTTLLRLCGLLDQPTSGEVWIADREMGAMSERERSRLRTRTIGYVFQEHHLVPHLTAVENVELALMFRGLRRASQRAKAESAIAQVGLGARTQHRPDSLSGGEGQRVAIARALVSDPAILLADEPTSQLDDAAATAVLEVFAQIAERGTAVLLVTHDARVRSYATSKYTMADGRLEVAP